MCDSVAKILKDCMSVRKEVKGIKTKHPRNTISKMKILLSRIYALDTPEGKIHGLEFKMKHKEKKKIENNLITCGTRSALIVEPKQNQHLKRKEKKGGKKHLKEKCLKFSKIDKNNKPTDPRSLTNPNQHNDSKKIILSHIIIKWMAT